MEAFSQVYTGFSVALQPINLLFCFLGTLIGTLVGVLPGLGPVAAMSLLLPATFHTTPEASIIMLAGIYYGSMYGGSTTSILMNIPGEAASVITCLDGHEMAKQGRAGAALGIAAFGSFIAATIGIIGLQLLSGPLVDFALKEKIPRRCGFYYLISLSRISNNIDFVGKVLSLVNVRKDKGKKLTCLKRRR